jgi:hypothetical protein
MPGSKGWPGFFYNGVITYQAKTPPGFPGGVVELRSKSA